MKWAIAGKRSFEGAANSHRSSVTTLLVGPSCWARLAWCALSLVVATDLTTAVAAAQLADAGPPLQTLPDVKLVQELTRPQTTTSVTWSSDGTRLAAYTIAPGAMSIDGKLVTVWNADGQIVREIEAPDLFFTSDDPLAFVGGSKEIVSPPWLKSSKLGFLVFDVATGTVLHEIAGPVADGGRPDNAASALVASPDESTLAVIFGTNRSYPVTLYSTRDWSKIGTLPNDQPSHDVKKLAFSPNGKVLAVARLGHPRLVLYDLASKQPVLTITGSSDGIVEAMAFNPDGQLLALGTTAAPRGPSNLIGDPVVVYRVKDGVRVASYTKTQSTVFGLAWSPVGSFIAFVTGIHDWQLHIWDPSHEQLDERIIPLSGHAGSIAFSPDGRRLAVAHGRSVAVYSIGQ